MIPVYIPAELFLCLFRVEILVLYDGLKVVPLLDREGLERSVGTLGENVVGSVVCDGALTNSLVPEMKDICLYIKKIINKYKPFKLYFYSKIN